MTRTVAAELDLLTEVIERDGAVAAQQIARSLGMSMSIVSQDTEFIERRRMFSQYCIIPWTLCWKQN